MYLEIALRKGSGRKYRRALLRISYREGNKVKHKTIASLLNCSDAQIDAIRLLLKNKNKSLEKILDYKSQIIQGPSVGAVYALNEIAKRLRITSCLGNSPDGKLALWQIIARLIYPCSKLASVRLAMEHAACDILALDSFNEDDLYSNLRWLSDNQSNIEKKLFQTKQKEENLQFFLYDVTSSYIEGKYNAYADYGYNKDKKKGKKQIVIGLLTDDEGDPVSVQVFQGNTKDNMTLIEQVYKVCEKFGVKDVIFVGDRGMIKSTQIKELHDEFQYITAITKPQVKKMIREGVIKLRDFGNELFEIVQNGFRYILRKNPQRKKELRKIRREKYKQIKKHLLEKNEYLKNHSRAKPETALKKIQDKLKKLKIDKWMLIDCKNRSIYLHIDKHKLQEETSLEGCYVIKTNILNSPKTGSKIIHDRYKDLQEVEWAFRTMKTAHLEIRPHYVRKAESTEGHVLIVMIAYKIVRYLRQAWSHINLTVEEGISFLSNHCSLILPDSIGEAIQFIPQPRQQVKDLLDAITITFPEAIPSRGINVATRKSIKQKF